MPSPIRVLFAGESWMTHSVHTKGFDSFDMSSYHEGGAEMIAALRAGGVDVTYQPAHVAMELFPFSAEELDAFDVVVLSDIGANSFLLPDRVAIRSESWPNRLQLIHDFVQGGGGVLMIGGYLTFQGIQAKGNYKGSPVEDVLPVEFFPYDDRCERPQGVSANHCQGRSSCPQRTFELAAVSRLQSSHAPIRRCRARPFRRRSLHRGARRRPRAQRDLFVRLRPPLGTAPVFGLERLRKALE